jgi:hypothetical protein
MQKGPQLSDEYDISKDNRTLNPQTHNLHQVASPRLHSKQFARENEKKIKI